MYIHCVSRKGYHPTTNDNFNNSCPIPLIFGQRPVLLRCLTLSVDAASDQTCCKQHVFFQQDNAPSHGANDTIKQLQQEIPDFVGPDLWPPNTPDPNLVDYKVWDVMQQRVHEYRMNSVSQLKLLLIDVWNSLQQNVIDAAINR